MVSDPVVSSSSVLEPAGLADPQSSGVCEPEIVRLETSQAGAQCSASPAKQVGWFAFRKADCYAYQHPGATCHFPAALVTASLPLQTSLPPFMKQES